MNVSTAVRKQSETVTRINDAISSGVCFKETSRAIHTKIRNIVSSDCKNAPRWMISYLRGYEDAVINAMIRDHIVHGKWYDGEFYCTYRNHPDYAETKPGFTDWKTYGEWPTEGGMYWRENTTREFYVHRPE